MPGIVHTVGDLADQVGENHPDNGEPSVDLSCGGTTSSHLSGLRKVSVPSVDQKEVPCL